MRFSPRLIIVMPLLLAACSGSDVRDTLGLNKDAPDEFVVVSRPPLSVPPEFDLRPPHPGEAPRMPSAEEQAHSALTGASPQTTSLGDADVAKAPTAVDPVLTADAPDGATASFLKHAGADKADDGIRDKLTQETAVSHAPKAKSLYDEVVGNEPEEPIVDSDKETKRLRDNKDAGKPANTGDVPTTTDKPKSVIDQIF